jgi:tRNA(Ile)-lysidine synthase
MPMLEPRVLEFFETVCETRADDCLLVAVSGGPDSVALLHALLAVRDTLGVRLEVAHLDHSMRGQEGEADAEFVSALSKREGLALHRRRVNIPRLWEEEGGSIEAVARRARYAFLEEARAIAGARWILTGHNANDQVETFVMNLLRGAGPRGMGGMLPVGPGSMARPLLGTWRAEILDYLKDLGETYCNDSTNQDLSRTRNWVRHRLVPFLEHEMGSPVLEILARESQIMNELDDFMTREAERRLETAKVAERASESDGFRLDVAKLREPHPALQRAMLRAALQDVSGGLQEISWAHIDALLDLCRRDEGSSTLDLPGRLSARREYGHLVLGPSGMEPAEAPDPSPPLDLSVSGEARWGRTRLRWSLGPMRMESNPEAWAVDVNRSAFDLARVTAPVYIRGIRPGDRMEPSGMEGTQKISDLLINRKVPRHLRTWVPVMCDNGGSQGGERILWVVGQRRSRQAAARSETAQVVFFEAETIL